MKAEYRQQYRQKDIYCNRQYIKKDGSVENGGYYSGYAMDIDVVKAEIVCQVYKTKKIEPSLLPETALQTAPQELTPEQQAQAGANIGALGQDDLPASLPPVTDADNGKILKVVNGAWAIVDA